VWDQILQVNLKGTFIGCQVALRQMLPGKSGGRRGIGVAPQSIVIWDVLTCREQLEMVGRLYDLPAAAARRRADELLAAFGLEEKRDALGRTLSGGMQRRLNIALGLVHEPTVVFLDEPQAGLDPQSRVLVREYIRRLAGRATVVVTTHDMEEAEKVSDRVCIVDHGKLLVLDRVEAIKGQLGEGDVFEVELAEGAAQDLLPLVAGLASDHSPATVEGHRLRFTSLQGAAVLPRLLRTIEERGWHLQGLQVRQRTLEDVFIRLTGRGLRE
jgi:ABC-2 type transport system ATP-binding protein